MNDGAFARIFGANNMHMTCVWVMGVCAGGRDSVQQKPKIRKAPLGETVGKLFFLAALGAKRVLKRTALWRTVCFFLGGDKVHIG